MAIHLCTTNRKAADKRHVNLACNTSPTQTVHASVSSATSGFAEKRHQAALLSQCYNSFICCHTFPTPIPHLPHRQALSLASLKRICRHMLQFNPDNYKYHQGLRRALNLLPDAAGNLSDDQREQLSQLYDGLQAQYPRSSAARRIPLDFKVCLAALPIDKSTCLSSRHGHRLIIAQLPLVYPSTSLFYVASTSPFDSLRIPSLLLTPCFSM